MKGKRSFARALSGLWMALLLAACGTPQPTPMPTPGPPTPTPIPLGAVSGRMMRADTEEPLAGARVFLCLLRQAEEDDSLCTLQAASMTPSDGSGAFSVSNVPPGSYVLMYGLLEELLPDPMSVWTRVEVPRAILCTRGG